MIFTVFDPIFKLKTPKLSERNGPICCLRVVVVRMQAGIDLEHLPPQNALKIVTFRQAQAESAGAYVAEILGPNFLGMMCLLEMDKIL